MININRFSSCVFILVSVMYNVMYSNMQSVSVLLNYVCCRLEADSALSALSLLRIV